ncbi:uncharacterized protein N0V89_001501 [Didymosphaeria variabile]|uniref:Transcription factor domain-containing protein n=1 Tax=Didymosphaeria variabile TaxID=1932322 RepID=A0A9W9CGT2_9PLEO|nr:uncharacterized protein N0V89_001501 [Didymosphaeria variabile]KAJ4360932.1 hypothetical protein N0V89_001501 [Didymosphaeria variabile]
MQESVDRQLTGRYAEAKGQLSGSSPTPNHLYSQSPQVFEAVAAIPPTHVAEFLFDVFFTYAHTNYVYANEQWLRIKLRDIYTTSSTVTAADSPWICTLLMVFAIGTQFAHLSSIPGDEGDTLLEHGDAASKDDETALYFYHAACKLIPDVMVAASIESVQAFLLLGVFTCECRPFSIKTISSYSIQQYRWTLQGCHAPIWASPSELPPRTTYIVYVSANRKRKRLFQFIGYGGQRAH